MIDSRTVAITNKERIQEWIDDFGIDSDFVKVRVLGQFPSSGSLQFMATADVLRAMMREDAPQDRFGVVKIGVDVARFGDDSSVVYPVMGNDARSFAPTNSDGIFQGLDNVQLAIKVIDKIQYFQRLGIKVGAVNVDVGGTGSGVVDFLRHSGYQCNEINFGTNPVFEPLVYRYRVDEMYGRLRERIKNGLVLPRLPDLELVDDEVEDTSRNPAQRLFDELTQREYGYTIAGDKINLESKKDMKARHLASPDLSDSLALTEAVPVAASLVPNGAPGEGEENVHDWDPLENASVA